MTKLQEQVSQMIYRGYTKAEIIQETTLSAIGYAETIRQIKAIMEVKTLKEIARKYEENLGYRN